MDTTLLVTIGITAAAGVAAVVAISHGVRASQSIDRALRRLSDRARVRWWRRPASLDREMRLLEEEVAASERDRARLAAAITEASIGILITDDSGLVVFANETASGFLGARHGEAVAEARLRQTIEAAIVNRRPERRELETYTPHRRYLDIRALPLDFGVESLGAIAYIHDVTESRRVDAMRSDFIANVSHELKTPLGALAVLAETLAAQSDDPAIVARMADRVVIESQRLSKLVGDILDLSQAEAEERPRAPIDLRIVVEEVVGSLRPAAADRGVELHIAPISPGADVWGDRRQLGTLVTNLVENAIKYSPSEHTERSPRVVISAKASKKEVILSVEDDGIGIPEQHLGRIFERFYRVDRGRGRESGGTGLGLSIARHIARNHGGDISVESQVGVGTAFRVRLPVWREP